MNYTEFTKKTKKEKCAYLDAFCRSRYGKYLPLMTDDEIAVGYANMGLYLSTISGDRRFVRIVGSVLRGWGFASLDGDAVQYLQKKWIELGMPPVPFDIEQ